MFLRIFLTLTLISTCCFGKPRHRPQHNIEGTVVDVFVYDQNPVNRQQNNGNVRCSGRSGNCAYVPNQTNQRYPNRSPNKGSQDEMIIVLVPENYNPGPYYPNFNHHRQHNPGLQPTGPYPSPYPNYPTPHQSYDPSYVHHRPQYPTYPTPNQSLDPSYVHHRPQYPTYPTPNQPYDPSSVNHRPQYPTYPTPNQPYGPSNVDHKPHNPTPNQPYGPSNVNNKPDQPSYSHPSPNNNEQGYVPSVSPSDDNQQDKSISTGQRPTSPINGNQKQNPDSNCLFGNIYCNSNANDNSNQPNPPVTPTLIDTETITPVPKSPIDKLPTTTMSVDDIIANVFDTKTTATTTTTQLPIYDIDIRNS